MLIPWEICTICEACGLFLRKFASLVQASLPDYIFVTW
jgi:hypothetical protein